LRLCFLLGLRFLERAGVLRAGVLRAGARRIEA
jgi:hypothetical protein